MKRLESIITALIIAAAAAVVVAAGVDNVVHNNGVVTGILQELGGVVLLVLALVAGLKGND